MKRKVTLAGSIRDFVERQAALPLESLLEDTDTPLYPYCEYWLRAVAVTFAEAGGYYDSG